MQPETKRLVTEARGKALFVRFEDTNGNPLEARQVVIKVDAITGEIVDIVSEAN